MGSVTLIFTSGKSFAISTPKAFEDWWSVKMFSRVASSIGLGQDIGEVSYRWNFDSWSDKLTAENNGTAPYDKEFDYDQVIKTGSLSISSKTVFGWHSWRKRWFVLTLRSLLFFKTDPSFQGSSGEVNRIIGGIILKNSGRVAIREEKKLLSIIFPYGSPFTLKAETLEELREWRTALTYALAQAPI